MNSYSRGLAHGMTIGVAIGIAVTAGGVALFWMAMT